MQINWDLVIRIAVPLFTLILGIFLNKWAEDRPRLITYISHTFAISSTAPNGQPISVHTHSVVVRNAGRKTATNVRLGHAFFPSFQIYPSIVHNVTSLSDGSTEIVIPTMVPKEQLTINYLYFPPVLWNQISTYTKSDQGFAKNVSMILTRQLSKKVSVFAAIVFMLGLVALGYLIVVLVKVIV